MTLIEKIARLSAEKRALFARRNPPSFAQERLWMLDRLSAGAGVAYTISLALELRGRLDAAALRSSLARVAVRHDALRTVFLEIDDLVCQVPLPAGAVPLPRIDLAALGRPPAEREGRRICRGEARRTFDLAVGPPWRVCLLRLDDLAHVATLSIHHAFSDGWSLGILIRDLSAFYRGALERRLPDLPELPLQYADFARWQRGWLDGDRLAEELLFWRGTLEGAADELQLPSDRPRPASPSFQGASRALRCAERRLDALRKLALEHGTTLFVVLLSAYQVLLSRLSGQLEFCVGTPIAGRTRSELEQLIGLFVNTLALRASLSPEDGFAHLVAASRDRVVAAFEHQELPFDKLVAELRPERSLSRSPLVQVLFVMQNVPAEALDLPGLTAAPWPVARETAAFDLTLSAQEVDGRLDFSFQHSTDLFDGTTVGRWLGLFDALVASALEDPERPLSSLDWLNAEERHQLLERNDTALPRSERSLVDLLSRQARETPDSIAVVFEGFHLSYRELRRQARHLAARLRSLGIGSESLVGVALERSLELVIALVGVLEAGAAYVPIDPSYPQERIAFMLEDAEVAVLLEAAGSDGVRLSEGVTRLALDRAPAGVDPVGSLPVLSGENLAYVIFTSGSTGRPKGAMNSHRAIANRLLWMQEAYALCGRDRVLQKTPFSFDVSVWEFFWPLMTGATLVVAVPGGQQDGTYLARLVEREEITVVHFVPSMMPIFLDEVEGVSAASLRWVICSGEALPRDLVERFFGRIEARLENLYGPTEAAVDVSRWSCRPDAQGGLIPIGRPISNLALHVVDVDLAAVPTGVAGELLIGGVGLARGYLRRADLTADRFIPDPLGSVAGARLYRTGDLARFLPDGAIDFLGRIDHQVKIRGFRIELGEIEETLCRHPEVTRAVAVARQVGGEGGSRLVAYFVAAGTIPGAAELRAYLGAKLPEYIVPSFFVPLAALPLSPNGKLDRRALPDPQELRVETDAAFVPPRNPVEQALVQIWCEVLGIRRIGVHDNFFELGGDSILGFRTIARARREGYQLTPRQLFQHQTVAELAAVAGQAVQATAEREAIAGPVPLSPIQRWFFAADSIDRHHFNQAVLLRVGAGRSAAHLARAWAALCDHHDQLRARFRRRGAAWVQEIEPAGGTPPVCLVDLAALPGNRRREAMEGAADALQGSLDLDLGPIARLVLLGPALDGEDRLLWVAHHLVVDGVSWRVLLEDLETAYTQLANGSQVRLPEKTSSFRSWVNGLLAALGGGRWREERTAWEVPESSSIARLPIRRDVANEAAAAVSESVEIDEEATRLLSTAIVRSFRSQIEDSLLLALAEAVRQTWGGEAIELDLEGHGREDLGQGLDVSRTVGWFTSLYPVRLRPGLGSIEDRLRRVKDQLRAVPDRGLGYGVLRYLGGGLAGGRAAEIVFNYLGRLDRALDGGSRLVGAEESAGRSVSPRALRRWDLEVTCRVVAGRLQASLRYVPGRLAKGEVQACAARFAGLLGELAARIEEGAWGYSAADFPLSGLTTEALDRLLYGRRGIEDVYPLTPLQQGMLVRTIRASGGVAYLEQLAWRLCGSLDLALLAKCWERVVERHPVLRTSFHWEGLEEPLQVVAERGVVPLERLDWRALPEAERELRIVELLTEEANRPFDLSRAPLFRLTAVRLDDDLHQLVLAVHHLLLDGWSTGLVVSEVGKLYEALSAGSAEPALPPPLPFGRYLKWLREQDLGASEHFWRVRLAGFIEPTPLPMEERTGLPADDFAERGCAVDGVTTAALRELARRYRVTLNTVAQGAWALLLARCTARREVVFGAVAAGRPAELEGAETMVGVFINTLPVRVDADPTQALGPWLAALQDREADVRLHEHAPLASVQSWSAVERGRTLFESLLVFENYPVDESLRSERQGPLEVVDVRFVETTNVALTLLTAPGDRLPLRLKFDPQRLAPGNAELLLGRLASLLAEMAADGERPVGTFEAVTRSERHQLIAEWNDTRVERGPLPTLDGLIRAQGGRTPDAIAVVFEGAALSYGELGRRANRLANRLRRLGIGVDDLIGVAAERSLDLVIALIGSLRSGGAYVPLDPTYPALRLAGMLEDARVLALVTTSLLAPRFAALAPGLPQLLLDGVEEPGVEAGDPSIDMPAEAAAYAIFTSGSTGRPKAAVNGHRAIVNRILWKQEAYRLAARDVVLQKTPFSFDVSVWEFFWPLIVGARLVVAKPEGHRDSAYLTGLIRDEGVSTLHFVPSMLQAFLSDGSVDRCTSLRRVMASGEALSADLARRFEQVLGPVGARLHNLYGPTEAAVDVTSWTVPSGFDGRGVPIGRPIANLAIFLLGSDGEMTPIGSPGELMIGGVGLGRGYLDRPDLTAERFVPSPFAAFAGPGERLYRTGDLARLRPDGEIEYLGRLDFQVKIRGFRIELGEIEAALLAEPEVREAVVVARREASGATRLVGYVVGAPDPPLELARRLGRILPDYMVPAAFMVLPALPLSANGKLDRRALPEPELRGAETPLDGPRTEAEARLLAILCRALRVERLGVEDNFFAFGGDSILALQVVSQAGREGFSLAVNDVFERPTARGLATAVEKARRTEQAAPWLGPAPLLPAQSAFFAARPVEPDHFNQALLLASSERLDRSALRQALGALIAHHEGLRARFTHGEEDGGVWSQCIEPPGESTPFSVCDLSGLPSSRVSGALEGAAAAAQRSLDLARGPLVRGMVFEAPAGERQRLLLAIHHLVVDGVSWRILLADLTQAYAAWSRGADADLAPVRCSAGRWATAYQTWARTEEAADEARLWTSGPWERRAWLPVDGSRHAGLVGRTETVAIELDREVTESLLRDVPRVLLAQVQDALLAAISRALAEAGGANAALIALEGHGREDWSQELDLSRTVGWFTSIFPFLLDLRGVDSPIDALVAAKESLRALPRRGAGFLALRAAGEASIRARLAALPQPEVLFNYLGQLDASIPADSPFVPASESAGPWRSPSQRRDHLLEVNASIQGGCLRVTFRFSPAAQRRETVERIAAAFRRELVAITEAGHARLVPMFSPADFSLARIGPEDLARLLAAEPALVDLYPLTPLQEGLLFQALADPASDAYVEQVAATFVGIFDQEAFLAAWRLVVERHAALRTRFAWRDLPRSLQVVVAAADLAFACEDWSDVAETGRAALLAARRAADRARGFDLGALPLSRLDLVRFGADELAFTWTFHHAILDGWSSSQVVREVFLAYRAAIVGEPAQLQPAPSPRDFAAWLAGRELAEAEAFWREALAGMRPTSICEGAAPQLGGGAGQERELLLRAEDSAALRAFCRARKVTLNTAVQAAWAVLLARMTGEADVAFGATVSGRPADVLGIERMVGAFINTLPVRVRFHAGETVAAWLSRLQGQQVEARKFEHAPLSLIRSWAGLASDQEPFDSLVVFESYPVDAGLKERSAESLEVRDVRPIERTHYAFTLLAFPGDRIALRGLIDPARLDPVAALRLLLRFETLLAGFAGRATAEPLDLPFTTAAERWQILGEWSSEPAQPASAQSVWELFAERAERTPDAVAILAEGEALTYSGARRRALGVAGRLSDLGVGADDRVALHAERSGAFAVAVLGILASGAAYVPLDPSYPAERLAWMLADCGARALLSQASLEAPWASAGPPVVALDEAFDATPAERGSFVDSGQLAYVLYTSGSTGRPKGVAMPHRALVNLIAWQGRRSGSRPQRTLQFAALGFDVSFQEMFATWAAGGALLVIPEDLRRDPSALLGRIERENVERLFVPFVALEQLAAVAVEERRFPASLAEVVTAGEQLRLTGVIEQFFSATGARLDNQYGPTEAHVVSAWLLAKDLAQEPRLPPIGRPIAGVRLSVVDRELRPAPIGGVGELLISGVALARGYLGRPDHTAERFVPADGEIGARAYRTGDLARWRHDGAVEYLGRIDRQIKVRGFRIEPGEIEGVLGEHPSVRAVAVAVRANASGAKLLAAFVTLAPDQRFDPEILRRHVANRLPEFMVPGVFMHLDVLPLTASGKVDRGRLPALSLAEREGETRPLAPIAQLLAGIWAEILGRDSVGADAHFFELGGHSLTAVRVASRLRQVFGVEVGVRQIFERPTLADLSALILELRSAGAEPAATAIVPRADDSSLPLSFTQSRVWFLDRLGPGDATYNLPTAVRIRGPLRSAVFQAAMWEIVRRHEILRTALVEIDGRPVQIPRAAECPEIPRLDLRALAPATRDIEARRVAALEAMSPFDLAAGRPLRVRLIHLADDEHAALLCLHHSAADGWSMEILFAEWLDLYRSFAAGEPSHLADLPVQYADFALWQRSWFDGKRLEAEVEHWRGKLAGAPAILELPLDRPRRPLAGSRGATRPLALPAELTARLRGFSRRAAATPFMVLLAAWSALLRRVTGQDDLPIGAPIAGRTRPEIERLIGFFANTLVLRLGVSRDRTFEGMAAAARELVLEAHEHQDLPFERLVEELAPERDLSTTPLFQTMFTLQPPAPPSRGFPGLSLEPLGFAFEVAKFDLSLSLAEGDDRFVGALEYPAELFDAPTIDRLGEAFVTLVDDALTRPETKVGALSLLSPSARRELASLGAAEALPSGPQLPLHRRFEAWAAARPDAPAILDDRGSWSYRELDAAATQIAAALVGRGAGPEIGVGVLADRSRTTLAVILGVLKAGGFFVPLDPEWPEDRLAECVAEARLPCVVIACRTDRELAGTAETAILDAVALWSAEGATDAPADAEVSLADRLAYVIYTSGSTGRPKGVMVSHQALAAHLSAQADLIGLEETDRVLWFANPVFDAAIEQFLAPLGAGAAVVIVPPGVPSAPELHSLLDRTAPTILDLPPAYWAQVCAEWREQPPGPIHSPRWLLLGGEAMRPEIVPAFAESPLSAARLLNVYGPTEATITATAFEPTDRIAPTVPIGRPLAGRVVRILDPWFEAEPRGGVGELCLGGIGLARGYLGRPDATAERFIPDPAAEEPGARLYRTGDLARFRADGVLEYRGRKDLQVKVRGFRIELEEIESALVELPEVRAAAAGVEGTGEAARLAAWIVPAHRGDGLQVAQLRSCLALRLQRHLVPSVWIELDELPLTAAGKIDRRALPLADASSVHEQSGGEPQTDLERSLAAIWRDVLGVERIGRDQDFFHLGGHSLLAMRTISRVRSDLGMEIPVRVLFEAPTLAAFSLRVADRLAQGGGEEREIADAMAKIESLSEEELLAFLGAVEESES